MWGEEQKLSKDTQICFAILNLLTINHFMNFCSISENPYIRSKKLHVLGICGIFVGYKKRDKNQIKLNCLQVL